MAGFRDRGPGPLDMRAVPHPALTLILAPATGTVTVQEPTGIRHGSLVAGLAFTGVRALGHDVEAVQIRLSPLLSHAVLGASPAELTGSVVTLDDLWGREAARIEERLGETADWQDRFALADRLLIQRRTAARPVPPEVTRAWTRIARSAGRVRIEELTDETGWSRQRLWSRFRQHIGLGPRRAAQLVRFHHAAHHLAAGRPPATAAATSGYYDQSHLNRHVHAFTGTTPTTLSREPFLAVDDMAWPGHAPPVSRDRGPLIPTRPG